MKVSMEWLREYAALDAPLDTLVQGLVDTGTEVEAVERGPAGVIVARILSLAPVPESTRGVQFADVDTGADEPLRVLTGAPNLAVGALVPYAPPGTQLVGLAEPLGVRAMFGGKYQSPGMLCSAAELGIGEDAGGILLLEHGVPGQPLHEVVDFDVILDLQITTNRPDCLCHLGVAREMAASIGETAREPDTMVGERLLSAASLDQRVSVEVQDADGCPRFAVRIIENLVVAPSPPWLQRRLRAAGLRPINNVVDVTNFVARELGQPLHAFDLDRFIAAQADGQRAARVVVRRGQDEPVLCLDGVERRLGAEDMAVCAGEHAVSCAGVIGGASTAVDETSRAVLLEAASWDGPTVRATSRRLGVRTDASSLYEKGLSDTLPPLALDRAAGLIAELGGGLVLRGEVDVRVRPLPEIPAIDADAQQLSALLGYMVDATEAATALARLGFNVEQESDHLTAAPPHFRRDVTLLEDVVEEVGRSLGYDRVPATLPGRRTGVLALAAETPVEDRVRDVLVGAGFDEAITWSFLSAELAGLVEGLGGARAPMALRNPLSDDWRVLRTSLVPGVLRALSDNLNRGLEGVRLFELGRVYWDGERRGLAIGSLPDGSDSALPPLPAEPLLLAMAADAADAGAAASVLRHLQAIVTRVARELGAGALETEPTDLLALRRGRSGRLQLRERTVGLLGEVDATTADRLGVRGRVVVAEVNLDALIPEQPVTPRYRTPPRFPAVVQDLAVVVPAAARAGDALRAAREAGGTLLESAELYDEYRSERLGADHKGWTFRLTYRAQERTLTTAEAQTVQATIAAALRVRSGAEVRR